jgi:hypothetical protein
MTDHARFSPSSAHRWLNCTASVDAISHYDDPPSFQAQEGSAAHFLLERCLVDGGEPKHHLGRTIIVKERGVNRSFVVTRDMAIDVSLAVDTIREIASHPGISAVEAKVDLSFIEPYQFGTTDLWHWGQDGVLTIVDFKYGRSDVSAERNAQLMIYACGVYEALKKIERPPFPYLPGQTNLIIIQPRSIAPTPRVKRWSFASSELENVADQAFDAITEANRFPRFTPGPWCEHCPALGECPATSDHRELATSLLTADMTVTDAERILKKKDLLEKIVKRAEDVMLDALLNGHKSENFPLVTKVKHRQWRDVELAKQRIVDEIGPHVLEPPTPAQTEKLGKTAKKIVQELAFTPPGEPTVGRFDDKRPPYLPKTAEMMFGASVVQLEAAK